MAEPQKAYEADTGELDIDMGDHDAAEVEIDEPQREDQSDDGDDGSEHDDVMNSAQKRINRLTKKMRDGRASARRSDPLRAASAHGGGTAQAAHEAARYGLLAGIRLSFGS
jgi:hypothetical protein